MLSIDFGNTYIISIPLSYLTSVEGTLFDLDTNDFRLDLKELESGEEGIIFPDTNRHNTAVTVAGTTFSRTLEILAPYSVEFENGAYSVRLVGSNNNLFDIQNNILSQNQVQVIPSNSTGLQTVVQGSGVTEQDKVDIIRGVWNSETADHKLTGTYGLLVSKLLTVGKFLGLKD